MKTLKSIYLLLVLSILLFSGMKCKKETLDPNGLPKATQTGAMVFACKVNGVNWISSKKSSDIGGGVSTNMLSVVGADDTSEFFGSFEIQIKSPGKNTNFRLNGLDDRFVVYRTIKDCFSITGGYGSAQAKSTDGEVIFTKIDQINKIISGTFWFDMPTDKCGILKITEGRFDIKYY